MTYKSVTIWWSTGERTDFKGNDIPDNIEMIGPFVCFQYYKTQKTISYYPATIDKIEVTQGDD